MSKVMYQFDSPLIEGIILKRLGRFSMLVELNNEEVVCHCPTTGRVGELIFEKVPCLLSKAPKGKRTTKYTVEAISLDLISNQDKEWIGINQSMANRYIEYFIEQGQLSTMLGEVREINREQKIDNVKIDFLIDNTYMMEVKTPLITLDLEYQEHNKRNPKKAFTAVERLVKHIQQLIDSLNTQPRAILLVCFLYDTKGFIAGLKSTHRQEVMELYQFGVAKGLEIWQINLQISKQGVSLIRYFPRTNEIL